MVMPFVVRNLAKRSGICQRTPAFGRERSIHVHLTRANAERLTPSSASPRPPFAERAMAIPAGLFQKPGDGRLDHSVEQSADRKDALPGGLGGYKAVRGIRSRRRHFHT